MKPRAWSAIFVVCCCLVPLFSAFLSAEEKLMVFCGAAFRLPVEEIAASFSKTSGSLTTIRYGSVPTMVAQVVLGKRGDILIAPSPEMMEFARIRGLIVPDSLRDIGYVVPAINVQKGNPRGIRSLTDLTGPGIRVAIGNPEIVFAGMLGAEIVDRALSPPERESFRKNIVTYPEDLSRLATVLALKQVDAIIGFSCLSGWHPDKIETIKLQPDEVYRIGAGQAAALSYCENTALAERFLDFLASQKSRGIFKKYHYFATLEEATAWVGKSKPVGGVYTLPSHWTGR